MNKFTKIIAILLVIFCTTATGFAKKSSSGGGGAYANALTVDPFGLSYGSLNLKYENRLSADNSFTIGGYLYDEDNWSGFGLSASYRWYIMKSKATPLNGLSVGPFAILSKWDWKGHNGKTYDGGSDFGIGGELNYKWVLGDWFTLEPNLQVFLPVRKADGHDYRGWGFGVSLGYSW